MKKFIKIKHILSLFFFYLLYLLVLSKLLHRYILPEYNPGAPSSYFFNLPIWPGILTLLTILFYFIVSFLLKRKIKFLFFYITIIGSILFSVFAYLYFSGYNLKGFNACNEISDKVSQAIKAIQPDTTPMELSYNRNYQGNFGTLNDFIRLNGKPDYQLDLTQQIYENGDNGSCSLHINSYGIIVTAESYYAIY